MSAKNRKISVKFKDNITTDEKSIDHSNEHTNEHTIDIEMLGRDNKTIYNSNFHKENS